MRQNPPLAFPKDVNSHYIQSTDGFLSVSSIKRLFFQTNRLLSVLYRMNITPLEFNFACSYAQQANANGLKS
jgi:hypothetical protein